MCIMYRKQPLYIPCLLSPSPFNYVTSFGRLVLSQPRTNCFSGDVSSRSAPQVIRWPVTGEVFASNLTTWPQRPRSAPLHGLVEPPRKVKHTNILLYWLLIYSLVNWADTFAVCFDEILVKQSHLILQSITEAVFLKLTVAIEKWCFRFTALYKYVTVQSNGYIFTIGNLTNPSVKPIWR